MKKNILQDFHMCISVPLTAAKSLEQNFIVLLNIPNSCNYLMVSDKLDTISKKCFLLSDFPWNVGPYPYLQIVWGLLTRFLIVYNNCSTY